MDNNKRLNHTFIHPFIHSFIHSFNLVYQCLANQHSPRSKLIVYNALRIEPDLMQAVIEQSLTWIDDLPPKSKILT